MSAASQAASAPVPHVRFIVPAHNLADLLVQRVGSCLTQSSRDLEIIVADDGSDDDMLKRDLLAPELPREKQPGLQNR